jgi:NAD(P)-dependent dehydrogenase (short-subunit alcohol dehydrogenase family)
MGRELVRQLVAEGCNVATCDVFAEAVAETKRLCEADRPPQGLRITTHIADVSDEAQVQRFRDDVAAQQDTDKIHLLFNNAGIGGGGSMIASSREEWEKTFNVCWGGVYNSTRAFLPMLQRADEGHIVNTSSINGFWASIGPRVPHLFCGEIRSERLHRGAYHRPPNECTPYQMFGRHARPNRNFYPIQLPQDP